MKKLLILLFIGVLAFKANAQTITNIDSLKSYISSYVIDNTTRQITPAKLRALLNGVANLLSTATDSGSHHSITSLNDSTVLFNKLNGRHDTLQIHIDNSLNDYLVATAVATSDYTITTSNFIILSDLTGQNNHNLILPTTPRVGQKMAVKNLNTNASTFHWLFTNGTVKDYANNTITTITNLTTYYLVFDGLTWDIIN